MKLYLLILFLFLKFHCCTAQDCIQIYRSSIYLFKEGKYDLALRKLAAYKICNAEQGNRADSLILKIYETINNQKNEATKQRNLANQRALTISNQKDSIKRYYQDILVSNTTSQAIQIRELNPTSAIQLVIKGLCFSLKNVPLTEIRKKILSENICYTNVLKASIDNTTCISRFDDQSLVTGDAEGSLKFWNPANKELVKSVRLFNSSISVLAVITDNCILAAGNDSRDYKKPSYILRLYNPKDNLITTVCSKLSSQYTTASYLGDSSKVFFGNEQGIISCFSLIDTSLKTIRKDSSKIIGIQCWQKANKTFYATSTGVYDLKDGKPIYRSKEGIFITYFGFCQSTGDMYIGIGEDLILFNFLAEKDQLLYPIHKGMISSCHCILLIKFIIQSIKYYDKK